MPSNNPSGLYGLGQAVLMMGLTQGLSAMLHKLALQT